MTREDAAFRKMSTLVFLKKISKVESYLFLRPSPFPSLRLDSLKFGTLYPQQLSGEYFLFIRTRKKRQYGIEQVHIHMYISTTTTTTTIYSPRTMPRITALALYPSISHILLHSTTTDSNWSWNKVCNSLVCCGPLIL
jgi:hypothetical protein